MRLGGDLAHLAVAPGQSAAGPARMLLNGTERWTKPGIRTSRESDRGSDSTEENEREVVIFENRRATTGGDERGRGAGGRRPGRAATWPAPRRPPFDPQAMASWRERPNRTGASTRAKAAGDELRTVASPRVYRLEAGSGLERDLLRAGAPRASRDRRPPVNVGLQSGGRAGHTGVQICVSHSPCRRVVTQRPCAADTGGRTQGTLPCRDNRERGSAAPLNPCPLSGTATPWSKTPAAT
jgi:hypothetical protein